MKLDTLKDDLIAWAFDHLNIVFSVLRWIKPTLIFEGKAFVTRFDDVNEVLERDSVFRVPYAEKMKKITQGGNFFLGMENTAVYTRDVSNMRLIVRREDISHIVTPFVNTTCEQIIATSDGKMDVVQAMTRVVPTRLIGHYFGTPGWNEAEFTDAATLMFQYLFYPDNTEVERNALQAADKTCAYLDQEIAVRKANRIRCDDDILGRCLKLQSTGAAGMSDENIRNNLIGLLIGAIPTTSKCAAITLNYLFDNPEILVTAQQAARADNDQLMVKYVLESLRFSPFAAGVQRICAEDYVVAKGTLRAAKIPKGTMVLVATQSAMMDWFEIKQPSSFRLDRPEYQYMHFGYGLHTCFGQYINLAQIPAIVKAVLKQKALRRTSEMKSVGPFPVSMNIEFDTK